MEINIDQNYLKSRLHYDPETGQFTWLPKIVTKSQDIAWNKRYVGKVAGSIQPNNYRYIMLRGKIIQAHRLAFMYMTGAFPEHQIDHIDGKRDNNRWSNIRAATPQQNAMNRPMYKNNILGVKGVIKTANGTYRAQVSCGGKSILSKCCKTIEEAQSAYEAVSRKAFGEFTRGAA